MLIYGYRNKEIEKGTGMFECPQCREQRVYKRKHLVRYFTLFFIPLFPLGKVAEYLECQTCKKTFSPDWFYSGALLNETESHSQSTSPLSPAQKGSCLTWSLLLAGGGACLFAGVFTLLLTLSQIDNPTNWEGFWGLLAICPAPLSAVGLIVILSGLKILSKKEENSMQDNKEIP